MCKVGNIIIGLMLLLCSYSDCKKKTISLQMIIMMGVAVFCVAFTGSNPNFFSRIAGAFIGILLLLAGKLTGESIGYGDAWIVLLLGIQMGVVRVLTVLFWAALLAGMCSLFLLWKCGWRRTATLPFIPFLTVGYVGVMLI